MQPGHKFCLLGRLSTEVGWHHYDTIKVSILLLPLKLMKGRVLFSGLCNSFCGIVQELEAKRKDKSKAFYLRKKQLVQLRLKAEARAQDQLGEVNQLLAPISY